MQLNSFQTNLDNGLTANNNHLKLESVISEAELTKGLKRYIVTYLVYEIEYGGDYGKAGALTANVTKEIKQLHQFDTLVKAQRKFARLDTMIRKTN